MNITIPVTIRLIDDRYECFVLHRRFLFVIRDRWGYIGSKIALWTLVDTLYNETGEYYGGGSVGFVAGIDLGESIADPQFFLAVSDAYDYCATLRRRELDEETA